MLYIKKFIILNLAVMLCALLITNIAQALEIGTKMPDVTLKSINGKIIKLNKERKIIVFIHYKSEKCKDLLSFLNTIDIKKKSLEIFAINVGEDNSNMLNKISNKYKIKYDILIDSNLNTTKTYQVLKLPSIFLINNSGNIQKTMTGFDQNIAEKIKSF